MATYGMQEAEDFGMLLEEMLERAQLVKQTNTIEPPLNKSDLPELWDQLESIFPSSASQEPKTDPVEAAMKGTLPPSPLAVLAESRKHIIEAAVRDAFNNILASTTIDSPSFMKIWNLLDIVSILSDDEKAEPALLFWLVEELLDSQTISGCRKIFDYLESRRERITAKHFGTKNLVILRSCNELLRRLSRAEDTAFCGRVFIFLFSSFPLGDRSSVNLRGEYHVENVTTFDVLPPKEINPEKMELDSDTTSKSTINGSKDLPNGHTKKPSEDSGTSVKGVSFSTPETPMSADQLYPIFWSLQQYFSQPKKLFDQTNFTGFKSGLEATMVMFKSAQTEGSVRPTKVVEDSKRGTKRKRGQGDDDLANAFNPKYLTSRDLFELEISDLSFRRHILVQVLIVMDFLLSLSAKAKEKLAKSSPPENQNPNKSVMYADQVLSEDDVKWASDTKRSIAEYLKQGLEGAFFYRMVETVLSRDKNWARWKIDNCPSIAKPAVTPEEYAESKVSASKVTANKRIRPNPLGSLDLKFLYEGGGKGDLDRLKDSSRYQLPSVKSFQSKMELDDMDIEMARDDDEKNAAIDAKASKSWRALRIATGTKFTSFDKIERSEKIDDIFKDEVKTEDTAVNGDDDAADTEEVVFPKDRRPIVISGPSGVGKGTLIKMILEKHSKALGKKASHTTRAPREGEVHGQHYFFVNKEQYDIMRDGDQFLEVNNYNGNDYGTSRKVVEGIIAQGKVPVMEMDMHGIQQLKDQSYDARFIFLAPPEIPELERRLQRRGSDDEDKIKQRLVIAERELEQAKVEGFHDKIFVNDDLETTYRNLESYLFGDEDSSNENAGGGADGSTEIANVEVEMADAEEASKDEVSVPEEAPALGTENGTPAAEADPSAIESKDLAK